MHQFMQSFRSSTESNQIESNETKPNQTNPSILCNPFRRGSSFSSSPRVGSSAFTTRRRRLRAHPRIKVAAVGMVRCSRRPITASRTSSTIALSRRRTCAQTASKFVHHKFITSSLVHNKFINQLRELSRYASVIERLVIEFRFCEAATIFCGRFPRFFCLLASFVRPSVRPSVMRANRSVSHRIVRSLVRSFSHCLVGSVVGLLESACCLPAAQG